MNYKIKVSGWDDWKIICFLQKLFHLYFFFSFIYGYDIHHTYIYLQRKGTDASAEGKLATNKVEEEFVEEEAIGGCTELKEAGGEGHPGKEQVTKIADTNNQPKKRYKDVTYTSCTARITVKVIVKWVGLCYSLYIVW